MLECASIPRRSPMAPSSLSAEHARLLATLESGLRALALRGSIRSFARTGRIQRRRGRGRLNPPAGQREGVCHRRERRDSLHTIGAGDYFGEMSLDGGLRSASVMTWRTHLRPWQPRERARHWPRKQVALDMVAQVIRRAAWPPTPPATWRCWTLWPCIAELERTEGPAKPGAHRAPAIPTEHRHPRGASREMVSACSGPEKGGYVELGSRRSPCSRTASALVARRRTASKTVQQLARQLRCGTAGATSPRQHRWCAAARKPHKGRLVAVSLARRHLEYARTLRRCASGSGRRGE